MLLRPPRKLKCPGIKSLDNPDARVVLIKEYATGHEGLSTGPLAGVVVASVMFLLFMMLTVISARITTSNQQERFDRCSSG